MQRRTGRVHGIVYPPHSWAWLYQSLHKPQPFVEGQVFQHKPSVSKCLCGLCNGRSMRTPRPLAASAPLQLLGRSRRATSPLRVAFSPTTAPHGVVAESAESNLAGNLAFGRAVLLTRADGLEVPHYFSAYVICGGTACAVQILSQVRGGL